MSAGERHLSPCLCADADLQLLRELIDAGYDQVLASRIVWDPTHPHALGAMRHGPTWRPVRPGHAMPPTGDLPPLVAPPRLRRSALVELAVSLGREIRRAGLGPRRADARTAPLQPQQGRGARCC